MITPGTVEFEVARAEGLCGPYIVRAIARKKGSETRLLIEISGKSETSTLRRCVQSQITISGRPDREWVQEAIVAAGACTEKLQEPMRGLQMRLSHDAVSYSSPEDVIRVFAAVLKQLIYKIVRK